MISSVKLKVLCLTDHRNHSPVESTYGLLTQLKDLAPEAGVFVASRLSEENAAFFNGGSSVLGNILPVTPDFIQPNKESFFSQKGKPGKPEDFDFILLRLPRPYDQKVLVHWEQKLGKDRIINRPSGIELCGSKAYLMNFPEFCPPISLCYTVEEVMAFSQTYSTVLKPLKGSGGVGILKIREGNFWNGKDQIQEEEFFRILEANVSNGYLAMQFLKNVAQGDKRILIFNGKITGAALRKAPSGSWISNASQGAVSSNAWPGKREKEMASAIAADLRQHGVIAFGIDTLVDNTGRRVLSEINASCVNGLAPAQAHSGKPVFRDSAEALWEFMISTSEKQ